MYHQLKVAYSCAYFIFENSPVRPRPFQNNFGFYDIVDELNLPYRVLHLKPQQEIAASLPFILKEHIALILNWFILIL